MIVILAYNMGNVGSVLNMIKKIGYDAKITNNKEEILNAEKIIIPGVGSYNNGIENLKDLNLIDILNKKIMIDKIPVLGICLGMQLMAEGSEEGALSGLGWIKGKFVRFNNNLSNTLKVPHMGWNFINIKKQSKILYNLPENPRFYFVHSYYALPENNEDILTTTNYGHEFVSSFEKDNIIGVQFHPEKSHKFGMSILKNFIELY